MSLSRNRWPKLFKCLTQVRRPSNYDADSERSNVVKSSEISKVTVEELRLIIPLDIPRDTALVVVDLVTSSFDYFPVDAEGSVSNSAGKSTESTAVACRHS